MGDSGVKVSYTPPSEVIVQCVGAGYGLVPRSKILLCFVALPSLFNRIFCCSVTPERHLDYRGSMATILQKHIPRYVSARLEYPSCNMKQILTVSAPDPYINR
jgi:hypothetical protein